MQHNFLAVYEAVLPLPNCMKEEGCRSILERKDGNDGFELDGDFIISTKVFFANIYDHFIAILNYNGFPHIFSLNPNFSIQTDQSITRCRLKVSLLFPQMISVALKIATII